jgi:hypothetical protein
MCVGVMKERLNLKMREIHDSPTLGYVGDWDT